MVSRPTRMTPPVECVRLFDAATGLDGVIAIHSTALGPGAGGCRLWHYDDVDGALADALRLAEGMSYKNALAGLPFGAPRRCCAAPPARSTAPRSSAPSAARSRRSAGST